MEIKMTNKMFKNWCLGHGVSVAQVRKMIETLAVKPTTDLNGDGSGLLGIVTTKEFLASVAK